MVVFMDNPLKKGAVAGADFFHRSFENSVFQESQVSGVWSMEGSSLCTIPCSDMGGRTWRPNLAFLAMNEQLLPLGAAWAISGARGGRRHL